MFKTELTAVDFGVIAAYIVTLLGIGFWVSFKKGHSEDLFLAGKKLGWFNIGLSIFGTNVSPGMMIASCGVAYASGIVAWNFEWLAWVFLFLLAMVFVPHYLNTKISTMPEFLNKRYGKGCREFLSWYAVFSIMWIWIGGMLFAGGKILMLIFDFPFWQIVVFLAVISMSFTIAGGLTAVVITDSFQSILMIVASAMLTLVTFFEVGSVERLIESVPENHWHLMQTEGEYPWYAILLGYPIIGIWFWCTDQTIVQRVLGARDLNQGQLGTVFAGALKIVTPIIFFLPGIICKVLHPDLEDPDNAYMTLVINYFPQGMSGLVTAVIVAALISSIDSGLNSLSTVFTLDIYKKFKPDMSQKEEKYVGRLVILAAGVLAVFIALVISQIEMDLFGIGQSMISFLAPAMACVFFIGILWPRATSKAALVTLIGGTVISIITAVMYYRNWPSEDFWPPFMLLSFYLFAIQAIVMVVVSLLDKEPSAEHRLPTLIEVHTSNPATKIVWIWWAVIAVIMISIYIWLA